MLTFDLDEGDEEKQEERWRFHPSYTISLTLCILLRVEYTVAGIYSVSSLDNSTVPRTACRV